MTRAATLRVALMHVYTSFEQFPVPSSGTALTIGNFDGVHRGHRAILRAARLRADRAASPVVVVTFEPHPLAILRPQSAPARLTTLDERLTLLGDAGADATIVLRSTPELLAGEALEFLRTVVRQLRPHAIVEGESFNFGRGRTGSPETLRAHATELGYEFETVPTARCTELSDAPEVSSSAVRATLLAGDVARAAIMLGRFHRVTGVVVRGAGRGATIGTPTANLAEIPQLLPAEGVYVGIVELSGGGRYLAATNIGRQPTFADDTYRVEAHLLGYEGDLRSSAVALYFVERLRGQRTFSSAVHLRQQIDDDIAAVRAHDAALRALRGMPALTIQAP